MHGSESIDILAGVGAFIETELLTTNSADAAIQLEDIEQAIGVSDYPIVRLPYRDLVMRAHAVSRVEISAGSGWTHG